MPPRNPRKSMWPPRSAPSARPGPPRISGNTRNCACTRTPVMSSSRSISAWPRRPKTRGKRPRVTVTSFSVRSTSPRPARRPASAQRPPPKLREHLVPE
jgi:hypothetical protein